MAAKSFDQISDQTDIFILYRYFMPIALSHIKYRQNFLTNLTIAELVIHDRSNVYLIADTQADIGLSFKKKATIV